MKELSKKRKRLINSFKYAFAGLLSEFKEEKNLKIHIFMMIIVIIAGILFKISTTEWIVCVILFGIVISAELFNTAIERIVDVIMPEINEKAKIIKDISAGAVLIPAICSVIVGLIIFVPKVFG